MKKGLFLGLVFVLNLALFGCQNNTNKLVEEITYDVKPSTVEFPYQRYDLTIGSTPLFIREYTPLNNEEGLYGYVDQAGETVIDYQFTHAENFSKYGYAEVSYSDGINVIDLLGNPILDSNMDGWEVSGYSETYVRLYNRYDDDNLKKVMVYDYSGQELTSYSESEQYLKYEEYPITISSADVRINDFEVSKTTLYSEFETPYRYSDIDFLYRNMISVETKTIIDSEARYGVYSLEAEEIVPAEYVSKITYGTLWQFSDIAPIVTSEGLLGFVDYTGKILIEPTYQLNQTEIGSYRYNVFDSYFYNGVQRVTNNDQQLIIDIEGNVLLTTSENQTIMDYNDERIAIENRFEVDGEEFTVVDVIDYEGNVYLRNEYYNEPVINLVFTNDESDIFFITDRITEPDEMYNHSGERLQTDLDVFRNYYHDIYISFTHGMIAVTDVNTNKIGFINEMGEWVIQPQFDNGQDVFYDSNNYIFYDDGYAVIYQDGYYGVINQEGEFLIDCVLTSSPVDMLDVYYELVVPEQYRDIY